MNNDEIGIKLEFRNYVRGSNKLDKFSERLKEIYAMLSAIDKGKLTEISQFNENIAKTNINFKNTEKTTEKMSKSFGTIFSLGKLGLMAKSVYNLSKSIMNLSQKSTEYIENLNLLEVAYSNVNRKTGEFNEDIKTTSARIEGLVNKMADVYGLDESDLARSFGIFKQLSNAMELPIETGEQLSELMVKMTNDIASLYNLDLSRASNALQSALAGQVRPIRSATGADITEKTLQKTVDALGLDTTISKLSFVEKRLVMVISLTNQLKNSQGDYGRTIESAANQIRVLHEQWSRFTRALGNVFYPLLKSILPVVNGLLMALTEITNIIANLLGFQLEEFDYSGLAGVSDYALDISDEFDEAGKNVDKLKKKMSGLRSFDQLNVISTPKDTSSGVSGGSGGINKKILDAFSSAFADYDDMLDKVKMKARDIRDSIMEWLGFTKQVNPLTGEIEWKYQGIGTTISNLVKTFKNMSPFMKVVTTAIASFTGYKLYKGVQNLVTAFGNKSGLAKAIKQVKENDTFGLLSAGTKFKDSIDLWSKSLTGVEKFKMGLIGAGGLTISLSLVEDSMKDMAKTGEVTAKDIAGSFAGILGSAGSLALGLGSTFGTPGFIVGGILGAITGLQTAFNTFTKYANTNLAEIESHAKIINEKYDELKKSIDNMNLEFQVADAHTTYYETLYEELKSIVDENGKINKGYEDRAKFITSTLSDALGIEIEITDGVIKNYQDLGKEIEDVIKKKEALAKLDILEKYADEAIEKQAEARQNESKSYKLLEEAKNNYIPFLEKEAKAIGITTDELHQYLLGNKKLYEFTGQQQRKLDGLRGVYGNLATAYDKAQKSNAKANETLQGYTQTINTYKKASTLATAGRYDELNNLFDHEQYLLNKSTDEQKEYWETVKKDNERYLSDIERTRETIGEEQYKALKDDYDNQIALANEKLLELKIATIKNVSDIDDEVVKYFYNMGNKSIEEFVTELSKFPPDVREAIINKMYSLGYDISKKLQEGINTIQPEIKFKTNLKSVANTINNFFSKLKINAPTKSGIVELDEQIATITNLANSFTKGTQRFINGFESGGMPKVGNLFYMNEKEPELLGTIGGKSFVANQSQMMDLLDRKIGNAQNNTGTQVINLYLDADHKIGSYTIEQLQNMAKTDGKPITIGG